jgi:excisionase family DNA binding protein
MDLLKGSATPNAKGGLSWLSKIARKKAKLDSPYKTEAEAAVLLGFSVSKLRRLRKLGAIGFILFGRQIRHTTEQIHEYAKSVSKVPCPTHNDIKSATTIFQNAHAVHSITQLGTTKNQVKHGAFLLAQQTFLKPN